MIQIYRFYKMCMLLSLFIEPSYFLYLISYANCMIIVQIEWYIFIRPSCTPCCGCVFCAIFLVVCLWQVYRKFQNVRQQHVWHEIASWDCRFKHVIGTCRLCQFTAMSGWLRCVRLKMYGLPESWQAWKYEMRFDFWMWKSTASCWRCMDYV